MSCRTRRPPPSSTRQSLSMGMPRRQFWKPAKQGANLHASWKQYLESAITTWRSFIEDFDKEDRRLEELIGKADMGLASCPELIRRGQESSDRGGAPRPNRDHRGRRRGIGPGLQSPAKSCEKGSKACWMA